MERILKNLMDESRSKMDKTVKALSQAFIKIRTGKASPAILEDLGVDVYGQMMPIKQLASISVPDPRMIVVHPWDKGVLPSVEKAILKSDLGLNPQNDGTIIRVAIPPLSEERRKELVKQAKKSTEESKVAVRTIRRDTIDTLKKKEKDKEISEDILHKGEKDIQKITDEKIKEVDGLFKGKEEEILTI